MRSLVWILHPAARRLRRLDLPHLVASGEIDRPEVIADLVRAYDLGLTAHIGTAYVAEALRKTGRADGLAELQQHLALSDPPTEPQRRLAQGLAWRLALLPSTTPAALDLAAQRLVPLAPALGARLTLAAVRLRQGRWEEVEPLCRAEIADLPEIPGTNTAVRANALALIALARHHLGGDAVALAREAVRVEPQAELVDEAVRVTGAAEQGTS